SPPPPSPTAPISMASGTCWASRAPSTGSSASLATMVRKTTSSPGPGGSSSLLNTTPTGGASSSVPPADTGVAPSSVSPTPMPPATTHCLPLRPNRAIPCHLFIHAKPAQYSYEQSLHDPGCHTRSPVCLPDDEAAPSALAPSVHICPRSGLTPRKRCVRRRGRCVPG